MVLILDQLFIFVHAANDHSDFCKIEIIFHFLCLLEFKKYCIIEYCTLLKHLLEDTSFMSLS